MAESSVDRVSLKESEGDHTIEDSINMSEDLEVEEIETHVPAKKGKKFTSKVWDYFDIVKVDGVRKAKCRHCEKFLSYTGVGGTGHLNKHYKFTCKGRHLNLAPGDNPTQKLLITPKQKKAVFDQEVSRIELVKMVVIHEYPLSIVDHIGFRSFVMSLNEQFKMISRNTLRNDIIKIYDQEMISLKDLLAHNKGRIAITTDMWTASTQKKSYMAVTSHFIDHEWKLHSRTLRFCFVPCPHTKEVIAVVLMECFSRYSLENKISSIVVDNCSTNDAMMGLLMDKLERSGLVMGGEFLHMRCCAHILNLIVQDGLGVIKKAIENVRECVFFWMTTPKRIEKFEEACRLLNLPKCKRIGLDCKTRWNSTFLMIESSLPFQKVFSKLKLLHRRLKCVVPSEKEWSLAALVCQKLEIFHRATKAFSFRNHPTANLFFRIVCEIKLSLRSWVEEDNNAIIKEMAISMIEKFDKYWFNINGILAIATILDPRNKMECVAHYFSKLYGEDADSEVKRIRTILNNLVCEYEVKSDRANDGSLLNDGANECSNVHEDDFARAKKRKIRTMPLRSEIDEYLDSDTLPEDDEFDVLEWWKREQRYPTLKKMAKDILAIPVSSVASESAFSMGGRVVSSHRSRLHSHTVEALMCLQSWIVDDMKGTVEGIHACSTINEDCDEVEAMDIIDLDIDDVMESED